MRANLRERVCCSEERLHCTSPWGWSLGRGNESPVLALLALATLALQVKQSLRCTATARKPITLFFICCSSTRHPDKCSIAASIKHLLTHSLRSLFGAGGSVILTWNILWLGVLHFATPKNEAWIKVWPRGLILIGWREGEEE